MAKKTDPTRIPPHNLEAEESLLGAALLSGAAFEVAVTEVDAADFYKPAHSHIHDAMRRLWEAGFPSVDPTLIGDELARQGLLDGIGGTPTLLTLQSNTPATSNAARYARIVVEHATLRRLIGVAAEVAELGYNVPDDVAAACDIAREMIANVEVPIGTGDPSPNVMDFLGEEVQFNWIVEGLLERRDRLVVTGGEGGGKSTLLRQLSVQLAAGIHPFRFNPIEPVKVLVVDLENSQTQIQRNIEPLVDKVANRLDPDNLRIEVRTEGLELTQRHDSRWLIEKVASNRPDVLITGPIYRLHAEDPNEELPARKVARVFDIIRAKYDCAIVLEAHSPHASEGRRPLRPFGSSLWMRWPEFGYGLRPDREAGDIDGRPAAVWFEAWRGPRDQRQWPERLSSDGAEFWPWRDSAHRPVPEQF